MSERLRLIVFMFIAPFLFAAGLLLGAFIKELL